MSKELDFFIRPRLIFTMVDFHGSLKPWPSFHVSQETGLSRGNEKKSNRKWMENDQNIKTEDAGRGFKVRET